MIQSISRALLTIAIGAALVSCKPSASEDTVLGDPGRLSEHDTELRGRQASPDVALLGFKLGDKLDLAICEDDPETWTRPCTNGSDREVQVFLPKDERPDWLRNDKILLSLDAQGRIEEVTASMEPIHFEAVLDMSQVKYGKPDYMPLQIATAIYMWNFADMQVTAYGLGQVSYVSIHSDVVRSRVQAESDADAAARADADAKKRQL